MSSEPLKRCKKCQVDKTAKSFEKVKRKGREYLRGECYRCRLGKGPIKPEAKFRRPLDSQRYIITSAQNATPVHEKFFAALKVAAKHLGAELVVIPLRYKNPTSQWTMPQQDHEWWAEETRPYLFNQRKKLGPNLVLVGDVKTIPTASSPLSGFESLTGAESCILGHTKMQLRVVPVPTGRFPKILTTTGACTKPNFTDSKSGAIGKFHHFLGALVVELQGKKFHLRQVNADRLDGSFIDLDKRYSAEGVTKAPPALGLVMGDTHARFTDRAVDKATFGVGGMVATLDPQTLVFHDLFDGYSVNPHHAGDPFIAQAKSRGRLGNVREEVRHAVDFVEMRAAGRKAVVVPSNHDNFLSRWVKNSDWKHDPTNAEFYLETAMAMLDSTRVTAQGAEYDDPFRHWVQKLAPSVLALPVNTSFKLGDIECSLHGDTGPNGSRGTLRNLSRMGTRVISGHTHTPGIEEGHYQCGTSTPLRLEYTKGPSSWLNTHCVVYANGKRALLTIIDGEWKLPEQPDSVSHPE